MEPFYRDHTQYGAVLAIFVPIVFGLLIEKSKSFWWYVLFTLFFSLISIGIVYTYSRAAWLSIFIVFAILIFVWLRIRIWVVVSGAVLAAAFIVFSLDDIVIRLEKNKTDSAENLVENVESITNITTDASNLERINRWKAVLAMTQEKPLFGWGPGTYMFEYAPFQQSEDLTIISTNFGDVGNAHSEYLGPMAESGIPGFILVTVWIFLIFITAIKAFRRSKVPANKHLLLYVTLGLATYFVHGFLNNFLDSDKASIPVFGTMAMIIALDILSKQKNNPDPDLRKVGVLQN
jgi:O-antigen ligase